MAKRVLIALGGNAIKQPDERGTAEEQMRNISIACRQIVEIARYGYQIVLTHGNGPQVGNLSIQQDQAQQLVPPQPIVILGAMTQGQIGYMIQQVLRNLLNEDEIHIITAITQVIVDRDDPDFQDPHKPIGPFYEKKQVDLLKAEKGWNFIKVGNKSSKPWRRVVPSPRPKRIVEGEAIKQMVGAGMIVIASGGGGIPVIINNLGMLEGVDAVIDKDLASQVLAEEVGADILLILTDVENVKLDFGRPTEKAIRRMTISQAEEYLKEGQFPAGSMGPKVEACIRFMKNKGEKAIITSLDNAFEAIKGEAGTLIIK